ncbi:hypothetical protein [Shewanella ulleungensis]|uniref:hypothetical protein n=1 Tax=Shewanella ulleungensis TaxID=2282699 RepID=UPI003D7B7918
MRNITTFFSILNCLHNKNGRAIANTTLAHTLRITQPKKNILHLNKLEKISRSDTNFKPEWNEDLSHFNLIELPDGIVPLNNATSLERHGVKDSIMGPEKGRGIADCRIIKTKSKSKLNEWIKSKAMPEDACIFVRNVLASTAYIDAQQVLNQFDKFEMTRKKQRIQQLFNYVESYNRQVHLPKTRNSIHFQEVLFKIPLINEVGLEIVSNQEMMQALKGYLTEFYPYYPIKLLVLHNDERLANENIVGHVHGFIDGQNRVTGRYDLRIAQIKCINNYLREKNLSQLCIDESGKLTRKQSSAITYHMQRMFYEYINKHLFNSKGLNAVFADQTALTPEELAKRKHQSRQAKSNRDYQHAIRVIEEAEKAKNKLESTKIEQLSADELLEKTKKEQSASENLLKKTQTEQINVANLIHENKQIIVEQESTIIQNKKVLSEIEGRGENVAKTIYEILRSMAYREFYTSSKRIDLAEKYLSPMLYRFSKYLPEILKPAFNKLAIELKDESVVKALDKQDVDRNYDPDDDLKL